MPRRSSLVTRGRFEPAIDSQSRLAERQCVSFARKVCGRCAALARSSDVKSSEARLANRELPTTFLLVKGSNWENPETDGTFARWYPREKRCNVIPARYFSSSPPTQALIVLAAPFTAIL